MNIHDFLDRLANVREHGRDSWAASCPAHPDDDPSLTVRLLDDGMILAHCFAGCGIEEICRGLGCEIGDLFPDKLPENRRSIRKPFPAAAILQIIAREALIVQVAASNLARGVELTGTDHARLISAVEKIEEGLRYAR